MSRLISSAVNYVKDNVQRKIKDDSIVIDATLGNGYDTLFLRKLLSEEGFLYGFDIQEKAIETTKNRLIENNCDTCVQLIHDGHENLGKYINEPVDIILYNLGYLPKGNKAITTESHTTLKSVKAGMTLLKKGGAIFITVYPGHPAGAVELKELLSFLEAVNQKKYEVMKVEFFNHKNNPPVVWIIERR